MGVKRLVRVNELIKQEVADALYRVMNDREIDFSAVSVTHVFASSDLHSARVLVSVRDHVKERGKILGRLQHHSAAIQAHLSKNVILKYTPRLTFELDESIEQGDRVLKIISEMEPEPPPPAGDEPDGESGSVNPGHES